MGDAATLANAAPARFAAGLTSIDPDVLDCLQVNLAVLADSQHGPGTFLWLGAQLAFEPQMQDNGLSTIEPSADQHLANCGELIGIRLHGWQKGADYAESPESDAVVYCVSDAYDLPWLPYRGEEHMEHGFLLHFAENDEILVIDGYCNDTAHGAAEPVCFRLARSDVDGILTGAACRTAFIEPRELPSRQPRAVLRANAEHLNRPSAPATVEHYVDSYRAHPDQTAALDRLALETWLLARQRKLHAQWVAGSLGARMARQVDEHAANCADVAAKTYFALRRARRGRPVPAVYDGLRDLLTAEAVLAADLDLR
jgi:hypothetical protein